MKKTRYSKSYKSAADIKVGVVGYGGAFNMGKAHLDLMHAAGMNPVAVVELDASRLEAAKQDFPGIGTFRSVDEMLSKSPVDLVVLITPHNSHAPLGLKCLKAGRHVVCEKPLAITLKEVDAMMAAASKSKVMLSTYHNRHWDGCILAALDLIHGKKAIGDVVRIECRMGRHSKPGDWWRSSKSISGGILYDWGVHLLEYAFQITGSEVTEVTGFRHEGFWANQTKWKKDTIEDESSAVLRFKNGVWMRLTITQLDCNPVAGRMEVTGTKGSLVLDEQQNTLFQANADGGMTVRTMPNPASTYVKYYENVCDHLLNGVPLVITSEWSRRPIEVLDLAGKSATAGQTMRIAARRKK